MKWCTLAIWITACHRAAPPADRVPHTTGAIAIDGEWDEDDWAKHALRAQLRGDDGALARPSSEVRFLDDGTDLVVALYAADENIESRDAFELAIGDRALHVDSRGHVTPKVPGLRAAAGYDEGTLDDPRDDDEEWVVELAIPPRAAGLASGVSEPCASRAAMSPRTACGGAPRGPGRSRSTKANAGQLPAASEEVFAKDARQPRQGTPEEEQRRAREDACSTLPAGQGRSNANSPRGALPTRDFCARVRARRNASGGVPWGVRRLGE